MIDASALFANIVCNATCSNLPTRRHHGLRRRRQRHDHRHQAGDFLAGGSGDDTILGLRGNDQIYGDSGVNVDVLTRGLTIPTLQRAASRRRNVDPLLVAGRDTLYGEGAGTIGTAGRGTETGYDDVIFGDHGRVTQLVADPNQPNPLLRRSRRPASSATSRRCGRSDGGDDVIHGNAGRDRIFGGNGNDLDHRRRPSRTRSSATTATCSTSRAATDVTVAAPRREHRLRAGRRRPHHRQRRRRLRLRRLRAAT